MNRLSGLFAVAILAVSPACAGELPRVSQEEAKQHLLKQGGPIYPPNAFAANIQGVVKLELLIDERGAVSGAKIVTGHPLLTQMAKDSMLRWTFRPFTVNGSVTPVIAEMEMRFAIGSMPANDERKRREAYTKAMAEAVKALQAAKFHVAEERASEALAAAQAGGDHEWIRLAEANALLGHARFGQRRYPEAEGSYTQAVEIRRSHLKTDDPKLGEAYSALGMCLLAEGKRDDGESALAKSVEILKPQLPLAENAEAKRGYSRIIALHSFDLARIAGSRRDLEQAKARCRDAVDNTSAVSDEKSRKTLLDFCSAVERGDAVASSSASH